MTEVRIAAADDGRHPTVVLLAGDDPLCGPTFGVHRVVGGGEVAAFDTGEGGPDGEWRSDLSGVGLNVTDRRSTT